MAKDTLTITDNRTGKTYEVPITDSTVRAMELRPIKVKEDEFGMLSYDPAFTNTASCRSTITMIDGANGILWYRGYPIEQLAEKSTFLETSYLVVHGELPTRSEFDQWRYDITHHTFLHENLWKLIAAATYRHSRGLPYVYPDNDLSYAGNFLNMLFKMSEVKYQPNPVLEKALDVLFILHADHEQNCSANAMRSVGSSHADPYCSAAAAAAALYGPLHGGANEAVLRMLAEIGHVKDVPAYVKRVKDGEVLLMGFGHRIYKNYDPRAKIIKNIADQVFEVTGRNPLLDIALELERIALEDVPGAVRHRAHARLAGAVGGDAD
jgi:citrate synthase